jgi:hypothetical protein
MLRLLEIPSVWQGGPYQQAEGRWRIGDLEEPAGFGLDAGGPVLEVVDGVREAVGDDEPEVVGGVDRGCSCRRATENTSAALAMGSMVCGCMTASWVDSVGGTPKGHPWTGWVAPGG